MPAPAACACTGALIVAKSERVHNVHSLKLIGWHHMFIAADTSSWLMALQVIFFISIDRQHLRSMFRVSRSIHCVTSKLTLALQLECSLQLLLVSVCGHHQVASIELAKIGRIGALGGESEENEEMVGRREVCRSQESSLLQCVKHDDGNIYAIPIIGGTLQVCLEIY